MKKKIDNYRLQRIFHNQILRNHKFKGNHMLIIEYLKFEYMILKLDNEDMVVRRSYMIKFSNMVYNTLNQVLNDLVEWKLITIVSDQTNQYSKLVINWGEEVYRYQNSWIPDYDNTDEDAATADMMLEMINNEQTEIETSEKTEADPVPVKKDVTEPLSYHADPEFKKAWKKYLDVRIDKGKKNSLAALEIQVEKLLKLSNNNKDIGLQILNNSINGNWWDLFPPPEITNDNTILDEFMPKPKPKLKVENGS